jgi:hypothetical protein
MLFTREPMFYCVGSGFLRIKLSNILSYYMSLRSYRSWIVYVNRYFVSFACIVRSFAFRSSV